MLDKKVLIVDDDAEFLQLVSLMFRKMGAQTITACDGLEGISKVFTERPDLILLARARTILRRCESGNSRMAGFLHNDGHLDIDVERRYILINNKRVKLTASNFVSWFIWFAMQVRR